MCCVSLSLAQAGLENDGQVTVDNRSWLFRYPCLLSEELRISYQEIVRGLLATCKTRVGTTALMQNCKIRLQGITTTSHTQDVRRAAREARQPVNRAQSNTCTRLRMWPLPRYPWHRLTCHVNGDYAARLRVRAGDMPYTQRGSKTGYAVDRPTQDL